MENATTQTQPTKTWERKDIYQQVTDTIIKQLETGTAPWQQPWIGDNGPLLEIPKNVLSGNHYRGINIVLLWGAAIEHNYQSSEWASFKQWNEKKEAVRKGEKGSMVVYYDTMEKEVDGEVKKIPFLKSSVVFNRCQLASYKPEENNAIIEPKPFMEKLDNVEAFIENTGAIINLDHSKAYYMPSADVIFMPPPEAFFYGKSNNEKEAYYSTLCHELIHWTGHPSRIERKTGKKFGDANYATEELVAELGAAFLCSRLEITQATKPEHASYIASWLKALKEDNRCIFKAASEASKAVDYLYTLQPN